MIVHRTTTSLGWWLSGIALLALAWWGRPLVNSDQFENHFFGLFYYSILSGMALFWALPSEQRLIDGQFERRTMLLGLLPIRKVSAPVSAFSEIRLEQDPNLFRKDTIWLMVCGEQGNQTQVERFAFANWPATHRNVAKAQALAVALSQATSLPIQSVQEQAE
ncbi:hypothetical protein NT239_08670 [Chitinibacter sp. SCUT-21]|uniref:hypothetical protein n=1 Tax=Chitinibacter sp. SCUT-21 TaxID=2970891 RepID=UPI0035A619FB